MELKEMAPEPVAHYKPVEGIEKPSGNLSWLNPRIVKISLRKVQKYSIWPLVVYFPLHAINTLITPSISPESAPNDVLMMVRAILPGFTSVLLTASVTAHLASGLILRAWTVASRWRQPKRGKNVPQDSRELESQRKIGLIGGLSGYFVGISKQLSYNPQVVSGLILAPAFFYHTRLMKKIPQAQGFDVDFDFVKWILQNDSAIVKWFGGIIPLTVLIWAASYHFGAGICQYARIRRLSGRKAMTTLIFGLTTTGVLGLWRMAKSAPVFEAADYQLILRKAFLRL
ncbi:LANO_0H15060g1_1 [Lachancea nothofagi CBS 11611]|uniref:LANO_0H15060g1_1 n=1 Tax=Lachancea nothofagi CBS 11611 TaxID=1266666 RepID=A0A1G4KMP8_9SACH|nr:LANO_0H15060g1_1 [Lachancea nothofagi CBS 11611]